MRNLVHRIARIIHTQGITPYTYRPLAVRTEIWRRV